MASIHSAAVRRLDVPHYYTKLSIQYAYALLYLIQLMKDGTSDRTRIPSASPLHLCQALKKLDVSHNYITGSLEPLRACTALTQLWATHNHLVGSLEPLEGCKALQGLCN